MFFMLLFFPCSLLVPRTSARDTPGAFAAWPQGRQGRGWVGWHVARNRRCVRSYFFFTPPCRARLADLQTRPVSVFDKFLKKRSGKLLEGEREEGHVSLILGRSWQSIATKSLNESAEKSAIVSD